MFAYIRTCDIRLCNDAESLQNFCETRLIDFVFRSSCHVLNKTPYFAAPNHFLKGNTMQAKSIQTGSIYHLTLGRNEVIGEVIEATENGWNVRLLASDKVIKVNNSDRFICKARTIATTGDTSEANGKKAKATTPKQSKGDGLSALDAAHKVLVEIGTALTVRQITEIIIEKRYCPNLNGATPHLTISSAIQREVARKGNESRFYKGGKGLFGAYSE